MPLFLEMLAAHSNKRINLDQHDYAFARAKRLLKLEAARPTDWRIGDDLGRMRYHLGAKKPSFRRRCSRYFKTVYPNGAKTYKHIGSLCSDEPDGCATSNHSGIQFTLCWLRRDHNRRCLKQLPTYSKNSLQWIKKSGMDIFQPPEFVVAFMEC